MHWQSTSSTPFKNTVNLPIQMHTSAFCSSQWGALLWLKRVFSFQRAKLLKARLYHHLPAFARLFIPAWALSFCGFSFVSSRKSCTNIFMEFCPCPEPYTLEILLLFSANFWLGMCRNGAPSFTTWSWFLSFTKEISQQILAQCWKAAFLSGFTLNKAEIHTSNLWYMWLTLSVC